MKRQIPTLKNMKQVHENYTNEDHRVWQILFDRQIKNIPEVASEAFIEGLNAVKFNNRQIPNFEETNGILAALTGWKLVAVEGIVDDALFFQLLSEKKFPATTWLRTIEELDYLEEPDMFHDVFAHVPLLANQHFVDFLHGLSTIALEHVDNPWAIQLLSRIYWFTVEFGLINENEGVRIYGAGILSSSGETKFSLSNNPVHHDYDIRTILGTGYRKDAFQECYFVIDSYEQMFDSMDDVKNELSAKLAEMETAN